MDIEEVAKEDPGAIKVYPFDIDKGISNEILDKVEKDLDLKDIKDWRPQIKNLENLFNKTDAVQIEINPWATSPKNQIYCVDAKINIDDNAKFRQKELVELRKNSLASEDVDPSEEKAIAAGLNYVALDGNIGCMVNGAGLAMATMDIIKLKGGEPANFLDVGGGANVEQVKTAFEILTNHPKVNCILINIFGGIMKCDVIAQGIMKAAKMVDIKKATLCSMSSPSRTKTSRLLWLRTWTTRPRRQ
jgi:succinyl-CoA synthetase beta subunit